MSNSNTMIAIIGMSGEFPGASNVHEFWQNLVAGDESISTFSASELALSGVANALWSKAHYVPKAGVLENIDQFAAEFFGYSPREASLIDPQQRKLLEHAWHACEDAAINPLHYEGAIGVFVGSSLNRYLLNNILSSPTIHESEDIQQILFGNGADYLATRIAYQLNCRGPALNIQTACSTSLVAVHEACQHLLTYQVDVALAGGVSISVPQKQGYLYSVDGMLAPDGHCKPFADKANGTLFSSGLGLVVLKRFDEAIADGNPIYALIKGSAINNDGHQKVGYTAPSVDGQAEVIAQAQAAADILPEAIGYIETHGTGTQLGDPIELAALQKVFAEQTTKQQFCALGSLKSNMGHLDVAAGITGLIKTALVLQQQKIPQMLHHTQSTGQFDWKHSAFYVNTQLQAIQADKPLLAAGVSSFGIGGTNAHVVLGRHHHDPLDLTTWEGKPVLLVFSAKTETALHALLAQMAHYFQNNQNVSPQAVARTLQQGRAVFRYRMALVVEHLEQAIAVILQKNYEITPCEQALGPIPIPSLDACDHKQLLAIANQWLQGYQIDWQSHYATSKPGMLHLPGYPFERKTYWIAPYQAPKQVTASEEQKTQTREPIDRWFYQPSWKPAPYSACATVGQHAKTLVLLDETMKPLFHETMFSELGELIFVYPADTAVAINANTYQINPSNPDHYRWLLEQLCALQIMPQYVIHGYTLTHSYKASSIAAFQEQQALGLMSVVYFTQAWEKIYQDKAIKLTVLTNRLNRIAEGAIEPQKAPVLAAVKVIPKEYRNLQTQLIDIDFIDASQYRAFQCKQIVLELAKDHYQEEEIVLRGTVRWVRDYVPISLPQSDVLPFASRQKNTVLIVGGLGQLGLDIADYFAQFPGMQLALVARKSMPEASEWAARAQLYYEEHPTRVLLERLIAIRNRGCEVRTYKADIADQHAIAAVVQTIEAELGAIHGVIHAAGETVNGMISIKTQSSLEESYQAKVYGSYHLGELFANKPLDFMILCSSMNAIIGGLGQLDNTAANAFIDYLAEYYAMQTGHAIYSINWGAINMDRPLKVNVVPQFADLSAEHKRNFMNDEETAEIYTRLLTHRIGPRIVISPLAMNDVLHNWNRVASFQELDKTIRINHSPTASLTQEDAPNNDLEQWITQAWSRLLGVDEISRMANFFSLGGHSLAAVQFMTRVLEEYRIKVHVMVLYEIPTVAEFATHLEQLIQQKSAS